MIEFDCPHCAGRIRIDDDSASGKQGKCYHCGEKMRIPATAVHVENPSTADPRHSRPHTETVSIFNAVALVISYLVLGITVLMLFLVAVGSWGETVAMLGLLIIVLVVQSERILNAIQQS